MTRKKLIFAFAIIIWIALILAVVWSFQPTTFDHPKVNLSDNGRRDAVDNQPIREALADPQIAASQPK